MAEAVLDPGEIFEARSKEDYIGKEIDWAMHFADGGEDLPGYARVFFRSRLRDIKYVALDVPIAEYPWLATMHRGEPVQVRGRIAKVGSLSIELSQPTLLQLVEPGS